MPTNILIVEDSADHRVMLTLWLRKLGYDITETTNGMEAVESVGDRLPDLILCDVNMPQMDGLAFCQFIKKNQETSDIPFVLLTSFSDVEDKILGAQAGADDYLPKGTDWRVMQARIEALLQARGRIQEKVSEEVSSARAQTLSQTVVTLAHHIKNACSTIRLTADAVDLNSKEDIDRLKLVCLNETKKIDAVLTGLRTMAESRTLKEAPYMGSATMFDLDASS